MPAADSVQLLLPHLPCSSPSPVCTRAKGRPDPAAWRVRLSLGARAVEVSFSRTPSRAVLTLDSEHDAPGAWSIALDLCLSPLFAPVIRSDSPARLHWGLSARAPGRDEREFFAYALRWTARKLAGPTLDRARLAAIAEGIRPALSRAAGDLLQAIDPSVRVLASRFAPPMRSRIAATLTRDRRGWLHQGAGAHPGFVLFALALVEAEETEDAGLRLLHDMSEGRRLGPALDDALSAWVAALRAWATQLDLWPPSHRAAWAAASALDAPGRAAILAAQKILIRRAGPRCDPALLLVPPPLRFAPEDVPAAPRANAEWFRVMRVPGVTVDPVPRAVPHAFADAFAAFASRHAVRLARVPKGIPLVAWLAEVREVLRAAGRTPSRATDPARLVGEVDVKELRRRLAPPPRVPRPPPPPAPIAGQARAPPPAPPRPPRAAIAVEPGDGASLRATENAWPSITISPQQFAPWRSERVSVTQITTLRELRAEGARMRHCVADYRRVVEEGGVVIFSARVDGNPITIAATRFAGGWRVTEWKGFANRTVTVSEAEALVPWLTASGIAYRVRP